MEKVDEGAGLHHRIRHLWLTRRRALRAESAELMASGRAGSFDHRGDRSLLAMRNAAALGFGGHLLFEVEAFSAEDFASAEEARTLIAECADIALAGALSGVESAFELRRHPEWLPELFEILRDAHRQTITALEPDVTADEPVPPYRRRLTVAEHAAARQEFERRYGEHPWVSVTEEQYGNGYRDLIHEFPAHGVERVLVLHPWLERFGCETDVAFLLTRHLDWIHLEEGVLTPPTFDWFIWTGQGDGEWAARDWPPRRPGQGSSASHVS